MRHAYIIYQTKNDSQTWLEIANGTRYEHEIWMVTLIFGVQRYDYLD